MSSNRESCLWEFTHILSFKARGLTSLSSKETIPVSPFAFVEEVFANAVFVAVVPGKEMMVNWNQTKQSLHFIKRQKNSLVKKLTIFAVLLFPFQDPCPRNRTPFWTPIQDEVKLGIPFIALPRQLVYCNPSSIFLCSPPVSWSCSCFLAKYRF